MPTSQRRQREAGRGRFGISGRDRPPGGFLFIDEKRGRRVFGRAGAQELGSDFDLGAFARHRRLQIDGSDAGIFRGEVHPSSETKTAGLGVDLRPSPPRSSATEAPGYP